MITVIDDVAQSTLFVPSNLCINLPYCFLTIAAFYFLLPRLMISIFPNIDKNLLVLIPTCLSKMYLFIY